MLIARTLAEAELYLNLLATADDAPELTGPPRTTRTEGEEAWSVRSDLGEVLVPYRSEEQARSLDARFGLGTSLLLDAGDWVQAASVWARRALAADLEFTGAPGQDRGPVELNWELARDAMQEALKFLPDGSDEADEVPADGFWSELGLRTREQDPGLFTRAKLTEDHAFYRDTLTDFRRLHGDG